MCGLAGFLSPGVSRDGGNLVLRRMAESLLPRGPDEEGIWLSRSGVVGLAHRRLSVIGLGNEGRQPMTSHSGRYVIAYNGEIYNYKRLALQYPNESSLQPPHSDTALLLTLIETYGLHEALDQVVGMFAFALWDCLENRLSLVRDRLGEKPLYFGWQGDTFLFGSTLAPLRVHPAWNAALDHQAIDRLVRSNYIQSPSSIHVGINQLLPGQGLELVWQGGQWNQRSWQYWSATKSVEKARANRYCGDFTSATDRLEEQLLRVVGDQMVADVPLGAFLSGGVDSSLIVAVMQRISSRPVKTFTIAFDDMAYDESLYAEAVAEHLGTSHTTYRMSHLDAIEIIPKLSAIYDQPFADASQIPTALVAHAARREVTVALTGDGGDEVFGGYSRYRWAPRVSAFSSLVPECLRSLLGSALTALSPSAWDRLFRTLPIASGHSRLGEKIHKLSGLLLAGSQRDTYKNYSTFWLGGSPVRGLSCPGQSNPGQEFIWTSNLTFVEKMMLVDTITYLPDDILVKVDRASMSVGLETRAPFLDHQLFEFAWSLPQSYRVGPKGGKLLLRNLLSRYVPSSLIERPKSGFAVPIGRYLRGPLRDWAEGLLDPHRLSREGLFDVRVVRGAWQEHLSGRRNRQYDLWSVLMFQGWLDHMSAAPRYNAHVETKFNMG